MDAWLGERIGAYRVEAFLGSGGVASVFRVRHEALGSVHALKLLQVLAPSLRRRLLLEGMIQAQVRHPNLVAVTDLVDHRGFPGLVMDYVDGVNLEAWMRGRRDAGAVDALAEGLFAGVDAVHQAGFIHRDLKPSNVLVGAGPRGLPVAKLADFGLAKRLDGGERKTRDGALMGTPSFMSPEQVQDSSDTDARTDVWALAAILYELCTGQAAFPGDDFQAMVAVTGSEPPCPSVVRPDLPARWVQAIRGGLVKDRARRLGSVAELASVWRGERALASPGAHPAPQRHLELLVGPPASRAPAPTHLHVLSRPRRVENRRAHSMRSNST